jgi:DNA-binding NarL/FixJ family response regulator
MSRVRVLIVDDHTYFRRGVAKLLEASGEFEVVGEAGNGLEALHMARQLIPDLVLMDISMPLLDGIQATRRVKAEMPNLTVVVLTSSDEDHHLFEAIKAGAQGYLLKNMDPEALHKALLGVLQGEAAVSRVMAARILEAFAQQTLHASQPPAAPSSPPRSAPGRGTSLTAREKQVLELVAKGNSNKEIGSVLGTAENTVKNHLKSILAKLRLQNRVQAAMFASREGLVWPPGVDGPPRDQ